jgi:hypothetical protein
MKHSVDTVVWKYNVYSRRIRLDLFVTTRELATGGEKASSDLHMEVTQRLLSSTALSMKLLP